MTSFGEQYSFGGSSSSTCPFPFACRERTIDPSLLPTSERWVDAHAKPAVLELLKTTVRPVDPIPPLPKEVVMHIASFLQWNQPVADNVYVCGGRNSQDGALASAEMFDSWHGKWVRLPDMTEKRAGCAASRIQGPLGYDVIVVTGGYDEKGIVKGLLASVESFCPLKKQWDSASIEPLLRKRWGHGQFTISERVYVVGGCSLHPRAPQSENFMQTLKSCEVYCPRSNKWDYAPSLNTGRAGGRVTAVRDRYAIIVGGCDDVFGRAEMLSTMEILDTQNHGAGWSYLSVGLAEPRTTAAVACVDDRIIVLGGAPSLASVEIINGVSDLIGYDGHDPEYHLLRGYGSRGRSSGGGRGRTRASAGSRSVPGLADEEDFEETGPPLRRRRRHTSGSGSMEVEDAEWLRTEDGSSDGDDPEDAVADEVSVASGTWVVRGPNLAQGRMGSQAIFLDVPAIGGSFPVKSRQRRRVVVVIGGEDDVDTLEYVEQNVLPPLLHARTAMSVCVAMGLPRRPRETKAKSPMVAGAAEQRETAQAGGDVPPGGVAVAGGGAEVENENEMIPEEALAVEAVGGWEIRGDVFTPLTSQPPTASSAPTNEVEQHRMELDALLAELPEMDIPADVHLFDVEPSSNMSKESEDSSSSASDNRFVHSNSNSWPSDADMDEVEDSDRMVVDEEG
eukprot:g3362.t1